MKAKTYLRQQMLRIRCNYIGLVFGCIGFFVALSPSLMPRPAFYMGIVAGVGFMIWYCIGLLVSRSLRKWRVVTEPSRMTKRRAWIGLAVAAPLFISFSTALARYWQNEQRALLDQPPIESLGTLTIVATAVVICVTLLLIQRGIRGVYRYIHRWTAKLTFLPASIGVISAVVVAAFIIVSALTGVLERTAVVSIDAAYRHANDYVDPLFPQPTSPLRSGSSESAASWEGLGREGRRFVSGGPTAAEIEAFTEQPAKEPIRAYAGLDNSNGRQAQVALVIDELERTGAFERRQLMVAIPTGSGWVEGEASAAFEYMHGGDTAIVSAQYSYLPSGFAFVLDQGDATAMAKELLHAVEDRIASLPEVSRPKLTLYGFSLGSYGGQADYTGERDFARRLDAGVLIGTPGFSEPWRTITSERDSGSPQVQPVYNDTKIIKFATTSEEIINGFAEDYKIVYFQYPTDPFVWFDARLLYAEPDWMHEAPGRGVSPHLRWFPVVTFLQVAVDQIFAFGMPGDNGHDYAEDVVAPIAAATKPQDWSAEKTRALQKLVTP